MVKKIKKIKQVFLNEHVFWGKWINMHELDQEKHVQSIVPIIERHWGALEKIGKDVGKDEVLRLKASLLNSYFLDLYRASLCQKKRK